MKTFKEFLSEVSYAATARAGERDWHSQETSKSINKVKMPTPDTSHNEKMFRYHARMAAAAKTKGDQTGIDYHNAKLKQYS